MTLRGRKLLNACRRRSLDHRAFPMIPEAGDCPLLRSRCQRCLRFSLKTDRARWDRDIATDRQAQQCRSAGSACRCPQTHRRSSGNPATISCCRRNERRSPTQSLPHYRASTIFTADDAAQRFCDDLVVIAEFAKEMTPVLGMPLRQLKHRRKCPRCHRVQPSRPRTPRRPARRSPLRVHERPLITPQFSLDG